MILLEVKLSYIHASIFEEDTERLSEEKCKELFLNVLKDDEYQCLFSHFSPKKFHELPFYFIMHLRKQFYDNKTLFQRCFETLNFRASPPMTKFSTQSIWETISNSTTRSIIQDSLRSSCSCTHHFYHSERTTLFKLASKTESYTFSDIHEICLAHEERTAMHTCHTWRFEFFRSQYHQEN